VKNEISMRFSAVPSNVSVARIAVATFAANADFTVPDVEEVKVAVSEAVSNVVLHAYPAGPGDVLLLARVQDGHLAIDVQDQGCGISDLAKAKEPGFTTLPEHMGLGLSFIESFMDSFSLESAVGSGTIVRMVKRRCP
jgi:stage II sporulation protein AB (anti-sigma F factor)